MPPERPAHPEPHPTPRGILCPYCGTVSGTDPKRCDRCGGFFDPLSRQATQNAMGPWFIRDTAAPFRPGCSFETLRDLIKRGKVTRDTILRGPSTRQYWNFASRTPGIANLLGLCHNCHVPVRPDDFSCASCGAVFTPETDRQHMGLAPVHLLPGQASPEIIAAASVDQARVRPPAPRRATPGKPTPPAPAPARPSRGARIFGSVLLVLLLLGAVTAGVFRFVVPMYSVAKASRPPGAAPSVQPQMPASKPAPVPVPKPEAAPAPVPTRVAEPARPAQASTVPGARAPSALLAAVLNEPFDGPAISKQIETLQRSGTLEQGDAWAAIVRDRGEQLRLRTLP